MGDCARIERLTNGYLIRVDDPKIKKANQSRSPDDNKPWKDPEREFVFKNIDEVLAWLKANLDKALPEDDYVSAFNAAVMEEDDDE